MRILIFALLFSVVSSAQKTNTNHGGESTKKLRGVVYKCDSLSKVYKKDVVSYWTITRDGIPSYYINYSEGGKLKKMKIPNRVK
jgi:hypothetical protein